MGNLITQALVVTIFAEVAQRQVHRSAAHGPGARGVSLEQRGQGSKSGGGVEMMEQGTTVYTNPLFEGTRKAEAVVLTEVAELPE